jgi:hypothetical protein
VTSTHMAAQKATSPPPPARTVAQIAGPVALIPKPNATVHLAGPTPTQHPLQGTWLSVTLTARGPCVVAVLVKAPVAHFKGTLTLPSRFTELDDPRFTGAPGLKRSDSAPSAVPAVTQRPAVPAHHGPADQPLRFPVRSDARVTSRRNGGLQPFPAHEAAHRQIRGGPAGTPPPFARRESPSALTPPDGRPYAYATNPTSTFAPRNRRPRGTFPQELALFCAENRERLLVVEETAMRGQLLVSREKRNALQAQLVEARRAVVRERDILDAARRDIERTTCRPMLPPPPPERLHAGNTHAEREAIDKEQLHQHLATTRGFTDQLRAHAAERDIAGFLEERRRLTTENLAQRRSGSKSGGSKSGGSKSGGLGDRAKDLTPPPRRAHTSSPPDLPPLPHQDAPTGPDSSPRLHPWRPARRQPGQDFVTTPTTSHAATPATGALPDPLHRTVVPASLAGAAEGSRPGRTTD